MTKRKKYGKKHVEDVPVEPETMTLVNTSDYPIPEGTVNKSDLKTVLDKAPELQGNWDIRGAAYVENFRVKYAEFLAELTKLAS